MTEKTVQERLHAARAAVKAVERTPCVECGHTFWEHMTGPARACTVPLGENPKCGCVSFVDPEDPC